MQVDGISQLTGLLFLDLSHNAIEHLDAQSTLPQSLCFIKVGRALCGCPATEHPGGDGSWNWNWWKPARTHARVAGACCMLHAWAPEQAVRDGR